jgi:Mg-chelatase subunit ChlD
MDLLFVLDISKSMLSGNGDKQRWFNARKFLLEFVSNHLTIGPDKVRVGIIPFSKTPDIAQQFLFSQTTTKENLIQHINGLSCCPSGTNQSYAMNHAVDNMLTTEGGDRREAINMLVVLTDGVPSGKLPNDVKLKQMQDAAARFRPLGATYGIGIGLNTKEDAELANGVMDAITGPDFPENKILVKDGKELTDTGAMIIQNIIDAACNECVEPED